MLKQTEPQTQNTKLFTEKPLQIFNNISEKLNNGFKDLLAQYSGLKLLEEESGSGLMTRGAQVYYFGNVQVFQIPSMFYHPLFVCNRIKVVLEHDHISWTMDELYNVSLKMALNTESEIREQLNHQRFLELDFHVMYVSQLDLLILKNKFDKLKIFLKDNTHKLKSLLGTEPRIKIISQVGDKSRSNLLVFNSAFKTFDNQPVTTRDLPTIETMISTLDLVISIKEKNAEMYDLLITEYILSLNNAPIVIERFVALFSSKRSSFDAIRSKSSLMQYLTNILDLAIERNGAVKVDQWIDNVKLSKHIPETDRPAFEDYMATRFMVDDVEMQHDLFRKQKNHI